MAHEAVIGLEVHAQLATRTKLFCGCRARFGAPPNSGTCPVCLGLPGALPVLSAAAVQLALRVGAALGCRLAGRSVFARKLYFYPDLPKGYQITQYEEPLGRGGALEATVDGRRRRFPLERIHLEEDAGKSFHRDGEATLVDLNRAGVPLVEIVSAPALRSGDEARAFVEALRRLLRYLDACDGNMAEGSLRCDANVSLREPGAAALGPKVEIKNLNSLRAVRLALDHEIARQGCLLAAGGTVREETRGWDADAGRSFVQRAKEDSPDYRYFPEPDLPPLVVPREEIAAARAALPEPPPRRAARFAGEHGLDLETAAVLTEERELADYFEEVVRRLGDARLAAAWIRRDVLAALHAGRLPIRAYRVRPVALAELLALVRDGELSGRLAAEVLAEMAETGAAAAAVVARRGLRPLRDPGELRAVVREVLDAHPDQVRAWLAGQERLQAFLMGRIMARTGGRADPRLAARLLAEERTRRR